MLINSLDPRHKINYNMEKIKVLLVEDESEIQEYTATNLKSVESIEFLGAYSRAEDLFSDFDKINPDVAILDIGLPGVSGIEAVKKIKSHFPNCQCIMFTVLESNHYIFEALANGASGYLLKSSGKEALVRGIHEVFEGGSPMTASIAKKIVESFRKNVAAEAMLTKKEMEILHDLKDGFAYKEIAAKHFISIHTVNTHIRAIYEKLHVHSKTEAINLVFKTR